MDITHDLLELEALNHQLQRDLEHFYPLSALNSIQCTLENSELRVLIEHEPSLQIDSETLTNTVLQTVAQFLQDHPSIASDLPTPLPIRLHLRQTGMTVPYISRSLQLEVPVLVGVGAAEVAAPDGWETAPTADAGSALMRREPTSPEDEPATQIPPLAEATTSATLDSLEATPTPSRWTPAVAVGAIAGVFALAAGLYAVSRPCVIGGCQLLTQAETMGRSAINTAQTTRSALAVVDAYDQLTEASYMLGTIPKWSPYYNESQEILSSFESDSALLGQAVTALRQANEAAKKSQNPPHPLPRWREIQGHWRDAIAILQKIPSSSPIYPLVQRKLQEYQVNLNAINERLRLEQTSQEMVKQPAQTRS